MGRDQKGGRQGSGKPGGAGRDHRPRNPESVLTRYDVIHLDDHMTMNVRRRRRNMFCAGQKSCFCCLVLKNVKC